MKKQIQGVLYKTRGDAVVVRIKNDLDGLRNVIGADLIEMIGFDIPNPNGKMGKDFLSLMIVCDEEGLVLNKDLNRHTTIANNPIRAQVHMQDNRHISGDFLVIGGGIDDDGDICGLPDDICERLVATSQLIEFEALQ